MSVSIKTEAEIELMAEGGRRLAEVLRALEKETAPGVTTKHLDRAAYRMIHELGAKPAFLHYRPAGARKEYPYTLCASINDVIVHGQPSDYAVRDGDLVKLDLGLIYKGWYLDSAVTVAVGTVSREAKKLMAATREALAAGIAEARPGKTLGDVGHAIGDVVRRNKFSAAEGLIGHGVGRELHEDPAVFNFGKRGGGEPLEEGMVIAIEPMVCAGGGATIERRDDSYATRDGSLAAHFEHTVAITPRGPRILTE
ncbi:MAG TPA: type I methionyl aminopeptidase [Candidatus Paceibacterota bacterium]|nr:type I methionyl aminopeptidase [Candidatus Paceibacterota bacterium]